MRELFSQKNPVAPVGFGQLFREACCKIAGHQFYVPASGSCPGLPQSHCYRCGAPHPTEYEGEDWVMPIG
jgi:hypothetical protein